MERSELVQVGRLALEALEEGVARGRDLDDLLQTLEKVHGDVLYAALLLETFDLMLPVARAREVFRRAESLRRKFSEVSRRRVDIRVALLHVVMGEEKAAIRSPKILENSSYQSLRQSSITDPLTGLYNPRHFREALYREIKRSRRYRLQVSLLFLDLDNFKVFNDTCGHPAGDAALREIAKILQSTCREIDTVCRYGGEEFTIILPSTLKAGARVLGEKLRRRIEDHSFPGDEGSPGPPLTISGGIATYPEDGDTVDHLVERADKALYQAKNFTKNAICYYYSHERRTWPRIEREYRLQWRVAGDAGAAFLKTRTRDISRGGLSFVWPEIVPLSTELELHLHPLKSKSPLALRGRVVRIERPDPRESYHIGVRFDAECSAETISSLDL